MRTQNGRRGYRTKYIQLVQSVWPESRARTLYSSIGHDFLPIPSGSCSSMYLAQYILVFHFAGSSTYNLFLYGQNPFTLFFMTENNWYCSRVDRPEARTGSRDCVLLAQYCWQHPASSYWRDTDVHTIVPKTDMSLLPFMHRWARLLEILFYSDT